MTFVDGGRYAEVRDHGAAVSLVLATPSEQITDGVPAASFRVESVSAAVDRAVSAGASIARAAPRGAHESRAVLRDLDGNPFVVYGAD